MRCVPTLLLSGCWPSLDRYQPAGWHYFSTVGDALAVARWMGQNGLTSIIVVTSNFHLPRALLELGCGLPPVLSIPHPAVAGMHDLEDWRSSTGLKVLAAEYTKFLDVWMPTRLIGCASFRS